MLSVLAACGDGGDPGAMVPVMPPPLPTEEYTNPPLTLKSTSTADMLAFLEGQEASPVLAGVLRIDRRNVDSKVFYDTIPGAPDGIIGYIKDGEKTVLRVIGEAMPNVVVGSGNYSGPLEMTYRTSPDGQWQNVQGDMGATVDFENQMVYTGGIATDANYSILMNGDATIRDGAIYDNATIVTMYDLETDGRSRFTGSTQGHLVSGTNGRGGVVGTVQTTNPGLEMVSGFVAIEYIE